MKTAVSGSRARRGLPRPFGLPPSTTSPGGLTARSVGGARLIPANRALGTAQIVFRRFLLRGIDYLPPGELSFADVGRELRDLVEQRLALGAQDGVAVQGSEAVGFAPGRCGVGSGKVRGLILHCSPSADALPHA